MFGSSCTGMIPLAVSAGVAVFLTIGADYAMCQSTAEVLPRGAVALQLPVAPYTPFEKVMAAPVASAHPIVGVAAAVTATPALILAPGPEPSSLSISSSPVPRDPKPAALHRWEVKTSDITLYRTLERWSGVAGYRLKWDAAKNFLIGAPDIYAGSFESALQSVLSSSGIRLSDYPLEACIYANTPPLVRITRQGEQARECSAVE